MTGREPLSAENIANQYDDDEMKPSDPDAVISWDEARRLIADTSHYWWAPCRSEYEAGGRRSLGMWPGTSRDGGLRR